MPEKLRLPLFWKWELFIQLSERGFSIAVGKFDCDGDIAVNGISLIITRKYNRNSRSPYYEVQLDLDLWFAYCQTTLAIRRFGNHAD